MDARIKDNPSEDEGAATSPIAIGSIVNVNAQRDHVPVTVELVALLLWQFALVK
jgi:hypothetical protein